MNSLVPTVAHGALAVARLPAQASQTQLAAAAQALGMHLQGDRWVAHDGSFAVCGKHGVQLGFQDVVFSKPPPSLPQLYAVTTRSDYGYKLTASMLYKLPPEALHQTATLLAHGFVETVPGFYAHADESWVAFTADVGMICGVGYQRYAKEQPTPTRSLNEILNYPQRYAGGLDFSKACMAFAAAMPGDPDLSTQLVQAGFILHSPGVYVNKNDESFVAITQREVVVGVGLARLQANSTPTLANPKDYLAAGTGHDAMAQVRYRCATAWASFLSLAHEPLRTQLHSQYATRDALAAAGFYERQQGVFENGEDGCFVMLPPHHLEPHTQVPVFGQEGMFFEAVPAALAPSKPPEQGYGFCAVSRVPSLVRHADTLEQLGFVAVKEDQLYVHADGSWVQVGTPTVFGHHQSMWHTPPKPVHTTPVQLDDFKILEVTDKRDSLWRCAQVSSMMNIEQARAELLPQKFLETSPGHFVHAIDGSFANYQNDPAQPILGVGQLRFSKPVPALGSWRRAPTQLDTIKIVSNPAVWSLQSQDLLKDDAPLRTLGFHPVAHLLQDSTDTLYVHADGSFVCLAYDPPLVGVHNECLQSMPTIKPLAPAPCIAAFGHLAIAQLDLHKPDIAIQATALGFWKVRHGLYVHADCSWVDTSNTPAVVGIADSALVSQPAAVTTIVQANTQKGHMPSTTDWRVWQEQDIIITHLPMLKNGYLHQRLLAEAGFQYVEGRLWHPDGTWVQFGASPPLGFQGYHLGEIPFNNRTQT